MKMHLFNMFRKTTCSGILFAFLQILPCTGQASLSVTSDTVITVTCEQNPILLDSVFVRNHKNEDIRLHWQREELTLPHNGTTFLIIDPYQYYHEMQSHTLTIPALDSAEIIFAIFPDTFVEGDVYTWRLLMYDEDALDTVVHVTAIAYIQGCITSTLDPNPRFPLHIFPNPFVTETQIQMEREVNNVMIEIFNMSGNRLTSIPWDNGKSIIINRGNLPSGNYFMRVTERDQVIGEGMLIILNK
jgi:hypothetical protein